MKYLIYISIILWFASFLFSQSVEELEKNYYQLQKNYLSLKLDADSINNVLEQKNNLIKREKLKQNKDENYLSELLKSASGIVYKVNSINKQLEILSSRLNLVRQSLFKTYSTKLDSLENLSSKNTVIKTKIASYSEKLVLYSPVLMPLKFEPKKILDLSIPNKTLYDEYINLAIEDVDRQLDLVNGLYNDVNKAIKLRKRTDDLQRDIELASEFRFTRNSSNTLGKNTNSRGDNPIKGGEPGVTTESENWSSINRISEQMINIGIKTTNPNINSSSKNLSMEEYKTYLGDIKRSLSAYKKLLNQKLSENE